MCDEVLKTAKKIQMKIKRLQWSAGCERHTGFQEDVSKGTVCGGGERKEGPPNRIERCSQEFSWSTPHTLRKQSFIGMSHEGVNEWDESEETVGGTLTHTGYSQPWMDLRATDDDLIAPHRLTAHCLMYLH
jgi:hypothetical protein